MKNIISAVLLAVTSTVGFAADKANCCKDMDCCKKTSCCADGKCDKCEAHVVKEHASTTTYVNRQFDTTTKPTAQQNVQR